MHARMLSVFVFSAELSTEYLLPHASRPMDGLAGGKIPSAVADDLGSDQCIRLYLIYMDVTYLYHSYVYSMRTVSNVSVFGRIISLYLSCMRLDSDDGWLVSGIRSQRHITH